jgi:MYXO-CTERM domain-containing protein
VVDGAFFSQARAYDGDSPDGTCRAEMAAMTRARCCAVLLLALFFSPRAAQAIGACTCNDRGWTVPSFARSMPLNPRIFVSVRETGALVVQLKKGGVEVPVDVIPAGGGTQNIWVAPKKPLDPGATYSLQVRPDRFIVATGVIAALEFETVAGATGAIDTEAPKVTDVAAEAGGLGGNCNAITAGATIKIASVVDDFPVGEFVVQMDVTVGERNERLFLPYRGSSQGWQDGVAIGEQMSTSGDCIGDRRLPGGVLGQKYPAKITVWDWSGNATTINGLELTLGANPTSSGPGSAPAAAAPLADAGSDDAQPARANGCQMSGAPAGSPSLGLFTAFALAALLRRRATGRRDGGSSS